MWDALVASASVRKSFKGPVAPLVHEGRAMVEQGRLGCRWASLVRMSARRDAWPFLVRLGGAGAVDTASPMAWVRAGLPPEVAGCTRAGCCDPTALRAGWVTAADRAWPPDLRGVPLGPVALAFEGSLGRLASTRVAIVGARACTETGRAAARALAHAVADAGGVVVSGLAWGIDAEAHRAAGGRTIAVLGQGLGAPMPAWQARLRDRVLEAGGLVVSEFDAHAPARPWTFPVRNRVLAALARAVVVVEAGARSGARITADLGLYMGREVLAVPGPPGGEASEGCRAMIEEGAIPAVSPAVVLAAAGLR